MDGYKSYQQTSVIGANAGKLIVMLYDGAILFLSRAESSIERNDLKGQSLYITKAQNILLELISSLNMKKGKEVAANLYAIYTYMYKRLMKAALYNDTATLSEVSRMLRELRESWAAVAQNCKESSPQQQLEAGINRLEVAI